MKRLLIFFIAINFVLCKNHTNYRKIGAIEYEADEYPLYVVDIRNYDLLGGFYQHKCMGTLLSQTWVISAKHCYTKLSASDVAVFHGDVYIYNAISYKVYKIILHDKGDLALLNIERINVPDKFIPKLSRKRCPQDVRAVYHSWGGTGHPIFVISRYLLYSTNDVNVWACPYPANNICFRPVDGTIPMEGDSGSGFITGYGPGPMFPESRDIKIIGVMEAKYQAPQFNSTEFLDMSLAERLSDYIPWITKYVPNLTILS
ncbi:tabserin-like [Culicoides brevitarsis]|uniref:tabserin-like n=1 Tax=Culicoides brevitarsis TaxID=469753 RepID=UPI00307B5E14